MRTYRFYKDSEGWFVDLPEWTGEKWNLRWYQVLIHF